MRTRFLNNCYHLNSFLVGEKTKAAFKTQSGPRVNLRVAGLIRTEANENPVENLLCPPAALPFWNVPEWGKVSSEGERKPDCNGQLITYRKPAEMWMAKHSLRWKQWGLLTTNRITSLKGLITSCHFLRNTLVLFSFQFWKQGKGTITWKYSQLLLADHQINSKLISWKEKKLTRLLKSMN